MVYPLALTIVNPGAETNNMTGWTASVAGWRTQPVRVHTGSYSFEGGIGSADPISYQDIAIPAGNYSDVDAGLITAVLTYWQNDYSADTDSAAMAMEARNVSNAVIGAKSSPMKGDCNEVFVQTTLSMRLPAGTRTIRLIMKAHRVTGSSLSAHIDDIVLTLTQPTRGTAYGVSGCDLWLKGDTISGAEGDPISAWPDSSGSGGAPTIVATGTYRPILKKAGTPGLNGLPSARGDGVDDLFTGGAALNYAGNSGMTIFAVVHPNVIAGANEYDIIARNESTNRGYRLTCGPTNCFFQIASDASNKTQRTATNYLIYKGAPMLVRARYNGTAGEQSIWINTIKRDGTIDAAVPSFVKNDGDTLKIMGGDSGSVHARMKGDMTELLVYGEALSDANCATIENALLAKYNLYVFNEVSVSPDLYIHQGVANDGARNFTFHTDKIQIRDLSWNVLSQNTSPFTGLPSSIVHCTDGDYYNGKIYAELDDYPSTGHDKYIGVYDSTTLARITALNIGAIGLNCMCVDPHAGILYGMAPGHLHSWRVSNLAYIGDVALTPAWKPQGMAYHNGVLYATIGDDTDSGDTADGMIVTIDPVSGVVRPIFRIYYTDSEEGCDFFGDAFRWLVGTGYVHIFDVVYPNPEVIDEGDGLPTEVRQNRLDISGNARHLSDIGDLPTGDVPGKIGNAAYFSGSGKQTLKRNSAPDLTSDAEFTVAFRMKPHRVSNPIVNIFWQFTLGALVIKAGFKPGQVNAFVSAETPSLSCDTGNVIPADVFSFIAIYFDTAGLYIDINDVRAASAAGIHTGIAAPATTIQLEISSTIAMAISIDEFGIWVGANALNAAQRTTLYSGNYGQRPSFS